MIIRGQAEGSHGHTRALHTVQPGWQENGAHRSKKRDRTMPVKLNTKRKSNQAFYNILLGVGAVIIMILLYKASGKGSRPAEVDGPKQVPVEHSEDSEKGAAADLLLDSFNPKKQNDVSDTPSRKGSSNLFITDALARDSRSEPREVVDPRDGPPLSLEACPENDDHQVEHIAASAGLSAGSSWENDRINQMASASSRTCESTPQENEQQPSEHMDVSMPTTCQLDASSELDQKDPEPPSKESSGPAPENRLDAFDELRQLKAKEEARKKLEEERNEAIARMAKLEEDQAKALEQEEAAEKAFKRFPYKARKAAVSKIGDKLWERSSWRARVAAAQEALQEDEAPREEKAKAPRKKGGRTEKKGN